MGPKEQTLRSIMHVQCIPYPVPFNYLIEEMSRRFDCRYTYAKLSSWASENNGAGHKPHEWDHIKLKHDGSHHLVWHKYLHLLTPGTYKIVRKTK